MRTISGSARLVPAGLHRLPTPGDVLGYDPTDGDAGAARVFELSGEPTRAARLTWVRQGRHGLTELHARLDQMPDPHPGAFGAVPAWQGAVRDATGRVRIALLGVDPYIDHPCSLHDLLGTEPSRYLARPIWERLRLAADVAAAVAALGAVPLVHGGISTTTVLVDQERSTAVLIGVGEGSVGQSGTTRVPVLDGHLAPESYDGCGVHPEMADSSTDSWALAVVLYHVLFGTHPYCHLPDLAPTTLRAARSRPLGPPPDPAYRAYRDWWRSEFAALPPVVADLFRQVLGAGWADRQARPTAAHWAAELGRWGGPPEIDLFEVDRSSVVAGEPVTLTWRTRYAERVLVAAQGHGVVTGDTTGSIQLVPTRSGPARLWVTGSLGSVTATSTAVTVLAVPPWRAAVPLPPVRQVAAPLAAVARPDLRPARPTSRPGTPPDVPRFRIGRALGCPMPPSLTTPFVPDPWEGS
ncbi:hypothetical protein ACGFIW_08135 [Micromonospora sp. NPDC048935]|uniref:hypothetical protein n=1 Tax=Micromonospora sp. NPDC048935 TaxID=3364262 RepID=UPI003719E6BF